MKFSKNKKKNKFPIPQELAEKYLSMSPEDLAVEAAREQLAIDILKVQIKEDDQIVQLDKVKKELEDALVKIPEVVEAQEKLKEIIEKHTPEELTGARMDLKALKQGWGADVKDRKKKVKFMMKTLKTHMENGELKSKKD